MNWAQNHLPQFELVLVASVCNLDVLDRLVVRHFGKACPFY